MHVRIHIGIIIIAVAVLMILSGCWSKQSAVNTMFSAEESGELTLNSKMEKFIEKMNWVKVEDDSPERETRSVYRKKGELLVKTRTNREPNIKNIKTRPLSSSGRLIRYDEDSRSFDEIKEMLLKDKSIVKIEPNIIIKSLNYNERDLNNTVFSGDYRHLGKDVRRIKNLMRLGEAGRLKTARRINVGILDTGIDFEHPDLAGNVKGGVNLIYERIAEEKTDGGTFTDEEVDTTEMDYNGHGTNVAGIIGALNNDKGIDGICENVNMYGIKAFNSEGYAYLSDIIEGMQWAVDNNIQVLNLSFGTYEYSSILEDAINDARNSGILIIASAGNDYADDVMYPAKFQDAFAVGSHNENGIVSAFSNRGGDVDIYAPGENLMSTDIGNEGYSKLSGTSAACAFVTGMAVLGLSENLRDVLVAIKNTSVKMKSIKNPDANYFPILNERAYIALMKSEGFRELTLTALGSKRVLYRSGETVDIDYAVQNSGLLKTEQYKLQIHFTVDGAIRNSDDIIIPALKPGGRHSSRYHYKLLPPLPEKNNYISANIIQADQGISYINKFPDGFSISVDDELKATPEVTAYYVTSPDFRDDVPRSLVLYITNTGSRSSGELTIKPFSKRAKEEGLSAVPIDIIGEDYTISALAPGESVRVRVPLTNFTVPEEGYLSVFAAIYSDRSYLATKHKTYKIYKSGSVNINFTTEAHKHIMDQAVRLLKHQGIYIPDLHNPTNNYFGPDNPIMDTLNLDYDSYHEEMCTRGTRGGYWTGDHYHDDGYTINFSFLNGHRDEDQIDIVYGQCGSTTWDSHFWMVDSYDSNGRGNAHSSFNKVHILLNGGENLDYGALGHYRAGHKRAAWYFVGRAAHLMSDMTVPEHAHDNEHGAVGGAYEDWVGGRAQNYGNYLSAAGSGGVINPYQSDNPLRFLAYTAAQVGDSFPWASTMTGTTDGADGDREALGDSPHYDSYMNILFDWVNYQSKKTKKSRDFPDKHPLYDHHLNQWEGEWCAFGICGDCTWEYANYAGFEVEDCNDNGHTDYDNSEDGYRNTDGDLAAIAIPSVNYAIKAVAGLIYYFAVETGQIQHTLGSQSGLTFETPCQMPVEHTGGVRLQCCE